MAKSLTVDLADPRVQQMLGVGVDSSGKREVVQLAGDAPDPRGEIAGLGLQSTHRLTSGKQEVVVLYDEYLLTVDVYTVPGEPVKVHLICPRCRKHSTISGDRKRIEYDPRALNPMGRLAMILSRGGERELRELALAAYFGKISIEAFECSWEIGDAPHVAGAVHTGAALCRLKLVIDNNRARNA